MGMYTELHFNSELKRDVPQEVLVILRYMMRPNKQDYTQPATPDHPLFDTERWPYLFTMDSYYFDADTHSTLRYDDIAEAYFLCVRSNLKNYDNEIEKFLDWIHPYLEKEDGEFLGFYRYEEDDNPTLIHYHNNPTNH